jgi:hypothetical protein
VTKGQYLYAVVRHRDDGDIDVPGGGLDGAAVEEIVCGEIGALVSSFGDDRARSSRANLSAHERVVEAARASVTVLPMRFGIVMPNAAAVVSGFLKPNQIGLSLLLAEVAGKVEYRLKATYLPDVAVREIVDASRRIQGLQARIRGLPEAASYHARINLGELVAAGLEDLKDHDAAMILDRIGRHCSLTDVLASGGEDVAVRAALLLDEHRVDDFQREVAQLADEAQSRLHLELIGPLAPWDFVDLGSTGWDQPTGQVPAGRR